jgi:hypothetical protein
MVEVPEREETISERVVWKRSDLSFFLVHLTKDRDSLLSILNKQDGYCSINGARNGFFKDFADVPSEDVTGVSLTEAPLDQIKHFAHSMDGDVVRKYSKYGVVFDQLFIRRIGGNPCFSVNTLADYTLRDAILDLKDRCPREEYAPMRRLLLYFNTFGFTGASKGVREVDFYWEREWRVPGNLRFRYEDIFVALCNSDDVVQLSEAYPEVPFICPDWNYDRILQRLRSWTISSECRWGDESRCPWRYGILHP